MDDYLNKQSLGTVVAGVASIFAAQIVMKRLRVTEAAEICKKRRAQADTEIGEMADAIDRPD